MSRSQAKRRSLLQTSSSSALAFAAFCLLPLACEAVPIQTPPGASAPVAAASSNASGSSGPRRPGQIPTASLGTASGIAAASPSGPGRPVPALQEKTLTAKE